MNRILQKLCQTVSICACVGLGSCSSYRGTPQMVFDLGAVQASQRTVSLPALVVAEPNVAPWLDSFEIFYRLNYANDHQLHPYTNSRWSMPPLQLFTQRLKATLAASGAQVLSTSENANNVSLVLRLDGDDFTQSFDSANHSMGNITIRVSLFDHRNLIAQKTFSTQAPSPSNDAAGGANALSNASDQLIANILQWLSEVGIKK